MEKSALVITSQDLVSSVNSLKIDEAKEFTPWRSLKRAKRYSDHNAILVHMSVNKHSKKDRGKRKLVWNFSDPLGWQKFHKITSSDRSLLQRWQNDNDLEINYEIWYKKVNVILRECFKKWHIEVVQKKVHKFKTIYICSENRLFTKLCVIC